MAKRTVDKQVVAVRHFNRSYTHRIGILDKAYLGAFSLVQVRVLYEIHSGQAVFASQIAERLGQDQGYLSRILRDFEDKGLVKRVPSKNDARRRELKLTRKGRNEMTSLDNRANEHTEAMLEPLAEADRKKLVSALNQVSEILEPKSPDPIVFRDFQHGDMGVIIERHASLYAREFGWNQSFEIEAAEVVLDFARSGKSKQKAWIAERNGQFAGCIFLFQESDTLARLRMLLVDPSARGQGLGVSLVSTCLDYARRVGFQKVRLVTMDVLRAARKIYQRFGFTMVSTEPERFGGKNLSVEHWELPLMDE